MPFVILDTNLVDISYNISIFLINLKPLGGGGGGGERNFKFFQNPFGGGGFHKRKNKVLV